MKHAIAAAVATLLIWPLPVLAQEALSRECNKVYAKLCKGVKPGPELVGKCFEKYPNILDKIPGKCTEDFQTSVEGYNAVKGRK